MQLLKYRSNYMYNLYLSSTSYFSQTCEPQIYDSWLIEISYVKIKVDELSCIDRDNLHCAILIMSFKINAMHTAERVRRNLSLQTDAQMNTISQQWGAVCLVCSDQLLCMAPEYKNTQKK